MNIAITYLVLLVITSAHLQIRQRRHTHQRAIDRALYWFLIAIVFDSDSGAVDIKTLRM